MQAKQRKFLQSLKKIASQKFTWFAFFMVSLTITAFNSRPDGETNPFNEEASATEVSTTNTAQPSNTEDAAEAEEILPVVEKELPRVAPIAAVENTSDSKMGRISEKYVPVKSISTDAGTKKASRKMIAYATSLLGTPYNYGGTSLDGFDCSGFIYHVFSKFDIELNRSSSSQSTQGEPVAVEEVMPGDLLFFTGTDSSIREVGHVGIVISEPGEPVSFVHSSSNGGVKISDLEGYYTTRFMFAKRMD